MSELLDQIVSDAKNAPVAQSSLVSQINSDLNASSSPQILSLPKNKSSWIADLLGGGIKGASNIGSTILQPLQAIGLPQAAASGLRSIGGDSNLVQSLAHG